MAWMSKSDNPFRYFNSSSEMIRLVVMRYVRFPLSLWNVEDLLFERAMDNGYLSRNRASLLEQVRPDVCG